MPQVTSPLSAALSAIYGTLAALQNNRNGVNDGIDPAITAATRVPRYTYMVGK